MFDDMTMADAVTATTGFFVLLSVFLVAIFGSGLLILPILLGILVIQSVFTGICPVTMLLEKFDLVK